MDIVVSSGGIHGLGLSSIMKVEKWETWDGIPRVIMIYNTNSVHSFPIYIISRANSSDLVFLNNTNTLSSFANTLTSPHFNTIKLLLDREIKSYN